MKLSLGRDNIFKRAGNQSMEIEPVKTYFSSDMKKNNFMIELKKCYQNPHEIFQRVMKVNDLVFINKKNNGDIKGYLFYSFINDQIITINDIMHKLIYNGYAFINEKYRTTGLLQELLLFSTNYFKSVYSETFDQLLFYAVTSNPIAYRSYLNTFNTLKPKPDERISDTDILITKFLREQLLIKNECTGNPFSIRTELPQRYNENMRQTLRAPQLPETQFMHKLHINEQNGDRLLFYWVA